MKQDAIRTKFYDSIITIENLPFEFESSDMNESAQANWHFDTEFILFTGDGAKVICGTKTYFPKSGDIIVINSGKMHTVEPLPGEVASYQFVIPDRKFCAKYGINTTNLNFCEKITDEKITNAFLDFSAAVSLHGTSPNITTAAKCVNTLLSFMILVCENYIVSESYGTLEKKTTIDYIRKTVEYILENSNKNIDLNSISAEIGISKFHLAREFKKYTGNTLINHINSIRCKEAEGYIMDGMSVEEAAFASGFNSLSHFSKTYKKINGVSPVTVRKAKGK